MGVLLTDIQIEDDMTIDATGKTTRAGDIQGDNYINALDISMLVSMFYSDELRGDLNRDGLVNGLDMSILLFNLYQSGE